jgi:hypothetical protein
MSDVARVYAGVWAEGRSTAAANAPDELKEVVKSTLGTCVRLTPYVDREVFAERLIARGIAADVAHMIAMTAEISDDNAFFSDRPPY